MGLSLPNETSTKVVALVGSLLMPGYALDRRFNILSLSSLNVRPLTDMSPTLGISMNPSLPTVAVYLNSTSPHTFTITSSPGPTR